VTQSGILWGLCSCVSLAYVEVVQVISGRSVGVVYVWLASGVNRCDSEWHFVWGLSMSALGRSELS